MLVTTKWLTTPTIGIFWTNNNNLTRKMVSYMLVSDFVNWRTSNTQQKCGTLRTMSLSNTRGVRRIHGSYVAKLRGANGNLERLKEKI